MIKVISKYHVQISEYNLSHNSIGKRGLVLFREFLENKEFLSFEKLDLSDNQIQALKNASILELRAITSNETTVIYVQEPPKVKKENNSRKFTLN